MKNYNMEHKSNQNTSSSDLHSSTISSVQGQQHMGQNISKILQLKQLYLETFEEERILLDQNKRLHKQLLKLKDKLNQLINVNFNTQFKDAKFQKLSEIENNKNQKTFKPGSIARVIRKDKEQLNPKLYAKNIEKNQYIIDDFRKNSFISDKLSLQNSKSKITQNILLRKQMKQALQNGSYEFNNKLQFQKDHNAQAKIGQNQISRFQGENEKMRRKKYKYPRQYRKCQSNFANFQ